MPAVQDEVLPTSRPTVRLAKIRAAWTRTRGLGAAAARRVRAAGAALGASVRRRRAFVLAAAAALGSGAAAWAFVVLPVAPRTLAELRELARARPDDAAAQRDLGHAQWDAGQRHAAIISYRRALGVDGGAADRRMIDDLVMAYGTPEQADAAALIADRKLAEAAPRLEPLASSLRFSVRWGAIWTLEKLGKASKPVYVTAYLLDLESPDCDVRRRAVSKLGSLRDRRALPALRAARAADQRTGGAFRSRCLSDRIDAAERKILARR